MTEYSVAIHNSNHIEVLNASKIFQYQIIVLIDFTHLWNKTLSRFCGQNFYNIIWKLLWFLRGKNFYFITILLAVRILRLISPDVYTCKVCLLLKTLVVTCQNNTISMWSLRKKLFLSICSHRLWIFKVLYPMTTY